MKPIIFIVDRHKYFCCHMNIQSFFIFIKCAGLLKENIQEFFIMCCVYAELQDI